MMIAFETRIGREFTPRALWERHRLMTIAAILIPALILLIICLI